MKPINEIIPIATKSLNGEHATHTIDKIEALPLSHISKLFRIFKMEYGTAFTSNFKSDDELQEAKLRWSQRLFGLTGEQIKFAIDNMGKHHKTFAPNLTQFVDLCKSQEPAHASHRELVFLPILKAEQSTGKKYLDEIKGDLK